MTGLFTTIGRVLLVLCLVPAAGQSQFIREWVVTPDATDLWWLAVDTDGNAYVTGCGAPAGGTDDMRTYKYSTAGVQQWRAEYDCGSVDAGFAIAVDEVGCVYVTGRSKAPAGRLDDYDYATVKYDCEGNELWSARYASPEGWDDRPVGIAVDASHNVYVAGTSRECGYFRFGTVKYRPDGSEEWVNIFDGGVSAEAAAMALGPDGGVHVTGMTFDWWEDYCTVKYSPAGDLLWAVTYHSLDPSMNSDRATALTVGADGSVYVTGMSTLS